MFWAKPAKVPDYLVPERLKSANVALQRQLEGLPPASSSPVHTAEANVLRSIESNTREILDLLKS